MRKKNKELKDKRNQEDLKTLELKNRHLFNFYVNIQAPLQVGNTPTGNRQILIGGKGKFKGERINGRVLPWGADWFLIRPDGVGELDVRVILQTDDDELIYMRSSGFLNYSPEVASRVLTGTAEPDEYYFREKTTFETGAKEYYWLNSIVAVGTGWYRPGRVGMSIYEIE